VDHWLFKVLSEFESEIAIIWRDRSYTYRKLIDHSLLWQKELENREITSGQSVGLIGDYSPQTCMLLLALIANRNIVVPIAASATARSQDFLRIAGAEAMFEFDKNDEWKFSRVYGSENHQLLDQLRSENEPGLAVFSSGSAGEYKGSLHNFNLVLEKFRKRRRPYRALTFLLLDHLGGINTLFSILTNGGTVISTAERTPNAICTAIERYKVQLLPATPTFLNMLLISEANKTFDLSSLEMITYGTEPMPEYTLQALHQAFPNVQLKQTYGLSELGVLRTHSRDSNSLWLKVGGEGIETKVIDGILWIRSRAAMLGYLNAPSPFDRDGWYNTQDAVEVDGEYIRILGRTSEIINVGGVKVYPAEIENVLQQMDNIREVTVWGKPNSVSGQVVAASVNLFESEGQSALERRIRAFCQEKLAPYKIPMFVEILDDDLHSERFKKIRRPSARSEIHTSHVVASRQ